MKKLTMYKDGGREIEINDIEDAAEVMIRHGWRLEKTTKPAKKVEAKLEVEEPAYRPTRRRAKSQIV